MTTETVVQTVLPASYMETRNRILAPNACDYIQTFSNYQSDYTEKPISLRKKRPTSSHRKNNPHPFHLTHLRRLCNEPVCKVKTIVSQISPEVSFSYGSSMKNHYDFPPTPMLRPTRFGCNINKSVPAEGIVPSSPIQTKDPERLLPACKNQTTLMSTANPFQYVPRRRRLSITSPVEQVFALTETCLPDKTPLGKSVLHNRPTRKLVQSAPQPTLKVPGFDGGAPTDPCRTITGRKKSCLSPKELTFSHMKELPKWMQPF